MLYVDGYGTLQSNAPLVLSKETSPFCAANRTCRTPSTVVATGVEWVSGAFSERQARLPSAARNAKSDCAEVLALTYTRPLSTSGDAAFCQPITAPP